MFSTVYNLAGPIKTNSTAIKSLLLCFNFPNHLVSVRNTDILKNGHKYTVCVLITEYVKGLFLYTCRFKTEALGQLGNGYIQSCF